ncbi:sulfatase-like hydrolase/transferase [Candidatus Poribacteria bacterium]|jgi:arylsulfatase A-like enzyme|nr:sulfatase-like hydrolase/transferase [Candidatus Poribacteria bacterium]MBT7100136.1 sulfatase-like hydrolase/transferase [Candidatus Poribacteria bacterium]MBT7806979.1 sulfatase-like hydrolase/transferase [Candidatus Poribacteria bacterium]
MNTPPAHRPNILIVTTDQQRTDSLSCYGSEFTHTPNIDRMASEGVRLDRAYCTNPVCTPSRVSIFTGKQVSRHGAWNVGTHYAADERMVSHILRDAGYRTHYIGKAHFQAFGGADSRSREHSANWAGGYDGWTGPYYGFDTVELALGHATYGISGHYGEWARDQAGAEAVEGWKRATNLCEASFGGNAFDWDIPIEYHNSTWTADRAIAFLRGHASSRPFLLSVGFQDPHHPHCVPVEQTDRVSPDDVPLPDFDPGELDDKPPHFLEAHEGRLESSAMRGEYPMAGQGSGCDYRLVSERDARLGRAYYHSMVKLIDAQLGRILDALDDLNLANDTLIVFTSDHGELLGDHGLWMKGPFHYEQLVRVPAVCRWPAEIAGGNAVEGLFSLADITPTCLSAAGVDIPADMDGVDALPLLTGQAATVRDAALVETVDNPDTLRLKTVVTADRKLTWYAGQPYGELYDLERDPREKTNRWDDADYSADRSELLGRLLDMGEAIEPRLRRHSYA